ncbi:hypothetical protein VP01_362g12 [Puccinia sorghi]|uniref:Uncharacterized protein n=1 Tax=Puccinia sorghi TaxID=27349 RepID=A0A0L6UWM7_9BASI|nr:hypothetical protein VP01_362g12 [Puccinia sorghi]
MVFEIVDLLKPYASNHFTSFYNLRIKLVTTPVIIDAKIQNDALITSQHCTGLLHHDLENSVSQKIYKPLHFLVFFLSQDHVPQKAHLFLIYCCQHSPGLSTNYISRFVLYSCHWKSLPSSLTLPIVCPLLAFRAHTGRNLTLTIPKQLIEQPSVCIIGWIGLFVHIPDNFFLGFFELSQLKFINTSAKVFGHDVHVDQALLNIVCSRCLSILLNFFGMGEGTLGCLQSTWTLWCSIFATMQKHIEEVLQLDICMHKIWKQRRRHGVYRCVMSCSGLELRTRGLVKDYVLIRIRKEDMDVPGLGKFCFSTRIGTEDGSYLGNVFLNQDWNSRLNTNGRTFVSTSVSYVYET